MNVHNLQKFMDDGTVKVYIVGGYVRDRLLGRPADDHDFVVVGGSVEMMESCGFQQVGADFPVFLADNGDQFALARVERKIGPGYGGFSTEHGSHVTLEEDLKRRDLTINAMAREVMGWKENGHATLSDDVIDFFGGQSDLRNEVLRHVSDAFREDPLRALRAARFAARYGFEIHISTIELMKEMGEAGEYKYLAKERVWNEISRALNEPEPYKFFGALDEANIDTYIVPGYILDSVTFEALDNLPHAHVDDEIKPVVIKMSIPLMQKLNVPSATIKFAEALSRFYDVVLTKPVDWVGAFKAMDLYRNKNHVRWFEQYAYECWDHEDASNILSMFNTTGDISFASIPEEERANLKGPQIGERLDELRRQALKGVL